MVIPATTSSPAAAAVVMQPRDDGCRPPTPPPAHDLEGSPEGESGHHRRHDEHRDHEEPDVSMRIRRRAGIGDDPGIHHAEPRHGWDQEAEAAQHDRTPGPRDIGSAYPRARAPATQDLAGRPFGQLVDDPDPAVLVGRDPPLDHSTISSGVTVAPGRRATGQPRPARPGVHRASRRPRPEDVGVGVGEPSTSRGYTFIPPRRIMSLLRSTTGAALVVHRRQVAGAEPAVRDRLRLWPPACSNSPS